MRLLYWFSLQIITTTQNIYSITIIRSAIIMHELLLWMSYYYGRVIITDELLLRTSYYYARVIIMHELLLLCS